jgi:BASS family bile acid:Na+ symporter
MKALEHITRFLNKWYSPLVVLFAAAAFFHPSLFIRPAPYIPQLLGVVMLGMGLSLRTDDFADVFRRPRDIAIGVLLQFTVMPLIGYLIARALNIDPALSAGFILVGCVPSGTASNVMTYLSKGDVALSVTISSVTTLIAPFVTPYLFLLLAGKFIPVSAGAMFVDILKIVVIPVLAGALIRRLAAAKAEKALRFVPVISIVTIIVIVSAVVAASAPKLASMAGIIVASVVTHNLCGYLIAYFTARFLCRMKTKKARAVMFEVGIQNSGLGAALAMAHLAPIAALPSALFSVWQNISGPILAAWWAGKERKSTGESSRI